MMDEGIPWAIAITILLCSIVFSVRSCEMQKTEAIATMVTKGADPIKAACAIRSSGADPICVLAVQK